MADDTSLRRVIFVGGTSRSGSTLLNLILARDDHGVALGEIQAMLRPVKTHHRPEIRAAEQSMGEWAPILAGGATGLHPRILSAFPATNFLVDSSKSVFWIRDRNRDCDRAAIPRRNVLIYKTPYELAYSYRKRRKDWTTPFIAYHRRYLSIIDQCYVVSYRNLVEERATLESLCSYLGIPYFPEKMNYWQGTGALFFGSRTPGTEREVRYEIPHDPSLAAEVDAIIARQPMIATITRILDACRNSVVTADAPQTAEVRLSAAAVQLHAWKYRWDGQFRRLFPKRLIDPTANA